MECKYEIIDLLSEDEFGFNRYIVECKFKRASEKFGDDNSFNRYIVECKYVMVYNY